MPLSPKTAYLLVTHGSRDPRPAAAVQALAQQVAACLDQPLIGTACLELAPTPLHQQIVECGDRALQLGYSTLLILPLFLLPGVHVRDDIPEEVAIAQGILNRTDSRKIVLHICPYLGSASGIMDVLARRILEVMEEGEKGEEDLNPHPSTPTILLAHGSRRLGGNQPIEAIATQLGVFPAYWSVSPSLETQIQRLTHQGHNHIIVLPYFLFAGGITDAIAQKVNEIGDRYPDLTLIVGQPLGARDDIAHVMTTLVETTRQNLLLSL